jgi:hypothetical protein
VYTFSDRVKWCTRGSIVAGSKKTGGLWAAPPVRVFTKSGIPAPI